MCTSRVFGKKKKKKKKKKKREMDEIAQAVKRSRSKSSPSPLDGIPYSVFKKCPALLVTLHNIFNLCWATSVVPSAWKVASIKLIGKSSARSDPSTPTNDRPHLMCW